MIIIERARSLSPSKDNTPTPPPSRGGLFDNIARTSRVALSPAPELQPPIDSSTKAKTIDDTLESLTGERDSTQENMRPSPLSLEDRGGKNVNGTSGPSLTTTSAAGVARSPTLSWQQRRPPSQHSERPRSRPLSVIATENAARSPRSTPEPTTAEDENSTVSRDKISQMLSSKDPSWFRQTADRGENSPAYRKNQVEDTNVVDVASSSRVGLPGMARNSENVSGKGVRDSDSSTQRSISPSRTSSYASSMGRSVISGTTAISSSLGSPLPSLSAHRFEPPSSLETDDDTDGAARPLAMSPAQGRISPERIDRPASPTKGLGGFVQSAMMKRSDSVNKRWSVQSPAGLKRGDSVASNRSSVDHSVFNRPLTLQPHSASASRETSPSRPTSSHSNATVVQSIERPGSANSIRSSITAATTSDFAKPSNPANRSLMSPVMKESETIMARDTEAEATPPVSPSKTMDSRRWSPTKASWLESALNKPDSPKPKVMSPAPQQPAWMAEIAKAKQNKSTSATPVSSPPVHKHQVSIGGLMRSPPLGGISPTPPNIGSFPSPAISGSSFRKDSVVSNGEDTSSKPKMPVPRPPSAQSTVKSDKAESDIRSPTPSTLPKKSAVSPSVKSKPETPPKKDFRSVLKPRHAPAETDKKEEPEFKNALGQLRRTKTQNYVAPDELKDNITRGKAALSTTGGPKKTERVDEFKEAILEKKNSFKKAQAEGTGVARSAKAATSKEPAPLPEALTKKASLSKANITKEPSADARVESLTNDLKSDVEHVSLPMLHKETSAPARLQTRVGGGGKLADRFNPALANILARGPPPAGELARPSSPVTVQTSAGDAARNEASEGQAPQLTHMTKARARGPRRKAPTNVATAAEPEPEVEAQPQEKTLVTVVKEVRKEEKKPEKAPEAEREKRVTTPSSPRKLAISDRLKFLNEAATAKESKTSRTQPPRSPSPVKDIARLLSKDNQPQQSIADQKPTLITKPKPATLPKSPSLKDTVEIPTKASPRSPPTSKPASPLLSRRPMPIASSKQEQSSEPPRSDVDTESVVSVRDGASIFAGAAGRGRLREKTTPVKEPIKLPTQKDEDTAMENAGLRSPNGSDANRNSEIPVEAPSPVTVRKSDPPPPTSPKQSTRSINAGITPRPLPEPPVKQNSTAPITNTATPPFPKKLSQPVPHSTQAATLLEQYFGKHSSTSMPAYKIDTAAVLASKPSDPPKIKSLRSQLFLLSGDGKKTPVPTDRERILFEDNMFLCTHTFGTEGGKRVTEVYFWAGDGVPESSIDDAELFAHREAKAAVGTLVNLRQGMETSEFIEALGGILIVRRGSSQKYDSLARSILRGRKYAGQMVFDEVEFSTASLCSGFPHLISAGSGKSYLWKGKGSSIDELSCARLIGMDFGVGADIQEVKDGAEPTEFLAMFGPHGQIMKSADHWRLKATYPNYATRLFVAQADGEGQLGAAAPSNQQVRQPSPSSLLSSLISLPTLAVPASIYNPKSPSTHPNPTKWLPRTASSSSSQYSQSSGSLTPIVSDSQQPQVSITEIAPFTQMSLLPNSSSPASNSNIFIIDAFFEIYVLVPPTVPSLSLSRQSQDAQYASFCTALLFAQEYAILAATTEDRPFVPVSNVVLEGVPRDLRGCFRKWVDGSEGGSNIAGGSGGDGGLRRGRSLRVVPLSAALDATRY